MSVFSASSRNSAHTPTMKTSCRMVVNQRNRPALTCLPSCTPPTMARIMANNSVTTTAGFSAFGRPTKRCTFMAERG